MSTQIDITISKASRIKPEKRTTHHLSIPEHGILYLCGKNRCGKSTVLQYIRSQRDSLKEINLRMTDSMESTAIRVAACEPITVKGLDAYDEIFCLDSAVDDPNLSENSCSAVSLIMGGGMKASSLSRGEKAMYIISRFMGKIQKHVTDRYGSLDTWKKSGKKGLIILDEVDEGLAAKPQIRFNETIIKKFCIGELGCDVICVTHSPLTMMGKASDLEIVCYDMMKGCETTPNQFFKDLTGYNITISE